MKQVLKQFEINRHFFLIFPECISHMIYYEPFKQQPRKIVKHTQTIHQQHPTNCLSMFDHFVGLVFKRLMRMYVD